MPSVGKGSCLSGIPPGLGEGKYRNIDPVTSVIHGTMAKPMLEYYKEVLSKISYADQAVFRKEMRKAFRKLVPAERETLKEWFRSACVCKTEAETRPSELRN